MTKTRPGKNKRAIASDLFGGSCGWWHPLFEVYASSSNNSFDFDVVRMRDEPNKKSAPRSIYRGFSWIFNCHVGQWKAWFLCQVYSFIHCTCLVLLTILLCCYTAILLYCYTTIGWFCLLTFLDSAVICLLQEGSPLVRLVSWDSHMRSFQTPLVKNWIPSGWWSSQICQG